VSGPQFSSCPIHRKRRRRRSGRSSSNNNNQQKPTTTTIIIINLFIYPFNCKWAVAQWQ
jgi:hypothetical protein